MKLCPTHIKAIVLGAVFLLACGQDEDNQSTVVIEEKETTQSEPTTSESSDNSKEIIVAAACDETQKYKHAPETIHEVVQVINSLPRPVSLECFIQALPETLNMNASSSKLSIQPADGRATPRIFFKISNLYLSFVPHSTIDIELELSEMDNQNDSVKGEIPFPVVSTLGLNSPFLEAVSNDHAGTKCIGCHSNEREFSSPLYENAYISKALRPMPSRNVPTYELNEHAKLCGTRTDRRCKILTEVFSRDVLPFEFSSSLDTLF